MGKRKTFMANPQKILSTVNDIISYGSGVHKVVFQAEKKFPRFKAGQFLHLTLDDFDPTTGFWPESRVFSISKCSEDRSKVEIVYSVKGRYTSRMERELAKGRPVWLKAPYGDFIISNFLKENDAAILIAGGTGVSPYIPFLSEFDGSNSVQLFYGVRNKKLILFEKELSVRSEKSNFFMDLFLEEEATDIDKDEKWTWTWNKGILDIEKILTKTKNYCSRVFFLSGPPAMIELFRKQLRNSGVDGNRIVIDEWS
jgi:ferredoxin-NADP reductase